MHIKAQFQHKHKVPYLDILLNQEISVEKPLHLTDRMNRLRALHSARHRPPVFISIFVHRQPRESTLYIVPKSSNTAQFPWPMHRLARRCTRVPRNGGSI